MRIQISVIDSQQYPAIAQLERQLQGRLGWTVDQLMALDGVLMIGAFVDQQMVGYLIAKHVLDEAELYIIGVDRAFQRQGVAISLLHQLFRELNRLSIDKLYLEVRSSNLAAISLYQKLGFKQQGFRKNYYPAVVAGDEKEDALLLSYDII